MSLNGSMSEHESDDETKIVTYRSRSKDPAIKDKSSSGSPPPKNRYSRSRSRSRSPGHKRARPRSRSRSPRKSYRSSRYSRSASHSRSGSYSPYRGSGRRGGYRSYSRSPMSNRKRHHGTRDCPRPSKCLGVFGLSIYTTESHLQYIFSKFGPIAKVQVVIDAKSGRSRGFAFVYFESMEDAKNAKEQCSGMEIDGRKIRVDFSITQRAHTPTPGIYMGKPTYTDSRWREDDYYYGGSGGGGGGGGGGSGGGGRRGGYDRYRRSPSPYYGGGGRRSRRYERSRSPSYSPRRYY